MNEMIKRVAKAIRLKHHEYKPVDEDYEEMAQAAIEAMLEPTEYMKIVVGHTFVVEEYKKMIDAALKD